MGENWITSESDRPLLLLGAGGQGRTMLEMLQEAGIRVSGFLDDTMAQDTLVSGLPVQGPFKRALETEFQEKYLFMLSFGDPDARLAWGRDISRAGGCLPSFAHPSAWISPSAELGRGIFIGVNSAVFANARIGDFCLVNNHCSIGHDCQVGMAALFGPATHLCGNVTAGDRCIFGEGSVVRPRVRLGDGVKISGNTAVDKDAGSNITVFGNPGRYYPPQ